ncbi:Diverse 7TM receptor transmembrane region [Pseudopedobacter saltans DSM 12145]|uniref:Diverse 7TM receptor transmembrane region n=1 Tax=Pseudopedobacter saltans (strain ATCC 51119 / DSM 12145 / JCM 21818 / CCUG 39354 / LMG 10337 / NBRC 100064 / NCIMB 13643) TaxID=762903 RepID=F0S668_PSESL|nr:7TM diverse intracellular signaling domain-containing protein [Pseudopedobacter saltans]ADY53182.1 Diverse 7TM receptor transmembrane region [Pseudopedobacter saltans DSM 12145]
MSKFLSVLFFLIITICRTVTCQEIVKLDSETKQHILSYNEIKVFEDKTGKLDIGNISSAEFDASFKSSRTFVPKTSNSKSTYWYKIRLENTNAKGAFLLEFYDQTIDDIRIYYQNKPGSFRLHQFGAQLPFEKRQIHHKNFTFNVNRRFEGDRTYYIAVKTEQPAAVMIVLKKVNWFIQYGLREYVLLGVLYGMILVFCLYNLVMFLAVRQKQYLFYVLYNLSIGMFEISSNGIGFQYLWPGSPGWNEIAYGVALYLAAIFSMLFTREFLHLKHKVPVLDKIILSYLSLRTVFFLICLFINNHWFVYKVIEVIPVLLALISGIVILRKGYYPARFFVAGYSFIFLGILIRIIKVLNIGKMPFGPANFYSLSFCLIMEMLFVTFAIGDNIRLLKKKKEKAQKRIIQELESKQKLKDKLNVELENKVALRTREVLEKSEIIEAQNKELLVQAEAIRKMNELLSIDNTELKKNITEVTEARVMSKILSYEEFIKIYPDNETCVKFLHELKEQRGFKCRKCNHTDFYVGHQPYSKRCASCDYEESVINGTIFQNSRIPLNKAFYMVYIVYTTKGKISSYKLAEILELRQATCWANLNKIKSLMQERKKEFKGAGEDGWNKLVFA